MFGTFLCIDGNRSGQQPSLSTITVTLKRLLSLKFLDIADTVVQELIHKKRNGESPTAVGLYYMHVYMQIEKEGEIHGIQNRYG